MSYRQLSAANRAEVDDYANAYEHGGKWDNLQTVRIWGYFARVNDALFRELPVSVETVPGQPYANQSELAADVARGVLKVSTDFASEHPVWTFWQNIQFRAVHDFHHVQSGGKFTWPGEKLACASHLEAMRAVDDVQLDAALVRVFESECLGQTAQAIRDDEFPAQDARIVLPAASVLV